MAGSHLEGQKRKCTGATVVTEQNSVYVNGKLWAVQGSKCSHGDGDLKASYGDKSVKIHSIAVSVNGPDSADPDQQDHPTGYTDTAEGSTNVNAYG